MMGEEDDTFLTELVRYHISGQLKVAPEHCSARVLDEMGKPHINVYEAFVELALFLKKHHLRPQQVQDFYPTPGTASTCMFYTGIDPWTMQSVFVPTDPYEKKLQRTLLQYWKPENRRLVIEALVRAGREDLIGHGSDCLVQPDREYLISRRAAGQGGPDPKLTAKPHPGARRPKSTHRKKR